jgi:hypothetical protein
VQVAIEAPDAILATSASIITMDQKEWILRGICISWRGMAESILALTLKGKEDTRVL